MIDITNKSSSLRKAIASAIVQLSSREAMDAVRQHRVPKGDIFEFSRAAGLLAIKHTSLAIPDCHPLPLEFASISYETEPLRICIRVEVHSIYRTGVEVEAMHGACITALTIYDMLKPLDKHIEIVSVKLETKSGGRSDQALPPAGSLSCRVVVCSDRVAAGEQEDQTGRAIVKKLENWKIYDAGCEIIPDEPEQIQERARHWSQQGCNLVLFAGGTGLSPRDRTPEALIPIMDRLVPGIMEAARNYGQDRTPYAMLSRGVAGFIGHTLVLALPGSVRGAEECLDAIFPQVLHLFFVAEGKGHAR